MFAGDDVVKKSKERMKQIRELQGLLKEIRKHLGLKFLDSDSIIPRILELQAKVMDTESDLDSVDYGLDLARHKRFISKIQYTLGIKNNDPKSYDQIVPAIKELIKVRDSQPTKDVDMERLFVDIEVETKWGEEIKNLLGKYVLEAVIHGNVDIRSITAHEGRILQRYLRQVIK